MAQLKIGGIYIYTDPEKKVKPVIVHIRSGSFLSGGRISNCWSGNIVNEDGTLGQNIDLLYLPDSAFEEITDTMKIIVHPKIREFYAKKARRKKKKTDKKLPQRRSRAK